MILLTDIVDLITLQTNVAVSTDWTASFIDLDYASNTFKPKSTEGNVAAVTATVMITPPVSTDITRQIKQMSVTNLDAAVTQSVLITKTSAGGTFALLGTVPLLPGDSLQYIDTKGFYVINAQGQEKFVGATGATGPQGAPGPTGGAGEDGERGDQGFAGPQGPPGASTTGAQGPTGPPIFLEAENGADGDSGAPGVAGAPGPTGSQGPVGPPVFLIGEEGLPGEDGRPGFAGPTGAQGPVGGFGPAVFLEGESIEGDAGPPGPNGNQGPTGLTGAQGGVGPAVYLEADPGEEGQIGPPGITGVSGVTGGQGPVGPPVFLEADAGNDGEPGAPGAAGVPGAVGSTGAQGPVGPPVFLEGDQGNDGDTFQIPGNPGATGPAGSTGALGPAGPAVFLEADSGADGDIGPPGQPGAAGTPGSAGAAGVSGPPGADGDSGDDGMPIPGNPGPQGATGSIGPQGPQGPIDLMWTEVNSDSEAPPQGNGGTVEGAIRCDQGLTLGGGTATLPQSTQLPGVVLTTPVQGAAEFDGTAKYFTPAAASRALDLVEYIDVLASAFTMVSQTGAQKMFNSTANGALTLPIGTYIFECEFSLTALSATSGSFGWTLGGSATFTTGWTAIADKVALVTATSPQMSYNTAANTALTTPSTATAGYAKISGVIRVTVAGTVIPQISQSTASAAIVGANSFFRCRPAGNATVATVGNWS
jgi:hypothetical protein